MNLSESQKIAAHAKTAAATPYIPRPAGKVRGVMQALSGSSKKRAAEQLRYAKIQGGNIAGHEKLLAEETARTTKARLAAGGTAATALTGTALLAKKKLESQKIAAHTKTAMTLAELMAITALVGLSTAAVLNIHAKSYLKRRKMRSQEVAKASREVHSGEGSHYMQWANQPRNIEAINRYLEDAAKVRFGKGLGDLNDHEWQTAFQIADKKMRQTYPGMPKGPAAKEKRASICRAIAGSLNQSDFARFEQEFEDSAVAELLPKTACVMSALEGLLSKPIVSGEEMLKQASAYAGRDQYDVIQVRPEGYGYVIKYAKAPEGTKPKEKKVSVPEAKQALPQEMLDTADAQGAATVTNVEAQPDPLEETPEPITTFGMYKVYEAGTGKQLVGFVLPGLLDPATNAPTPDVLFANGGQFAIQPGIVGTLLAVSHNFPQSEGDPRGLGLFYKSDGRTMTATVPYTIVSKVTVEGQSYYAAKNAQGVDIQITPSDGIKRPLATSPTEIAIPAEYEWLLLDNEIQLEGGESGADVMAPAKQAAAPSMVEIRAWKNDRGPGGGCRLSGPVFSKHGSGDYDWADGVFWLACAGMPQNVSVPLLDKAASSGEVVRIYGLQPLREHAPDLKEAAASALGDLAGVQLPERVCLLRECVAIGMHKEARALVGTDSIDNMLSLNFINPENVETFVDYLPEFEGTVSKLAALNFAIQLGLQGVPDTACQRAMSSLENVIDGLKSLKTYRI